VGIGLAGCGLRGEERPDILVVVLDSLRAASLPFHGHPRNTAPFLSDLAARSVVFSRCYSAATWTRPAVTSLLSGLPPLAHQGWRFDKAFPKNRSTFARPLGESGYRTGFFTANPAIGESYGLEDEFEHVSYEAASDHDLGARVANDCLAWAASADADVPTLVYIHFWPPHGPYLPPEEFIHQQATDPALGLDHLTADLRYGARLSLGDSVLGRIPWYQAKHSLETDLADYLRRYEANITYADALVADFVGRWRALERRRRTVLIVTGDHGEGLGEHGLMCDHGKLLIDEILHVPLIVHDSERRRSAVINEAVSHLDLAPTVLMMAGLGCNFGMLNEPLLDPGSARRVVVSQEGASSGESGWALTSGRWRLVYNGGSRYGGSGLMGTDFEAPVGRSATFVPTAPGRTGLRWPVQVSPDAVLESLALSSEVVDGTTPLKFAGVLHAPAEDGRLVLRANLGGQRVELGEFSDGGFAGEVTPFSRPPVSAMFHLEGAWNAADSDRSGSTDWFTLLSVACRSPLRMTDDLELAAVDVEPAVARPGETFRVNPVWRIHANVDRSVGVIWRLVDVNGREVFQEVASFFRQLPDPEASPRPLIGLWRLAETTFDERPLVMDGNLWFSLPTDIPPGRYRLEAGLVDYPLYFNHRQLSVTVRPAECASIEVVDSHSERINACIVGGFSLPSLPPAHEYVPSPEDLVGLEIIRKRHPEQGQLDYLLASVESEPSRRLQLLEACRAKVPTHLGALRELAAEGDADAADRVARLTPDHVMPVSFNDVVSLVGFDLHRHAEIVYVTLYWRAEISTRFLLSAAISAEMDRLSEAIGRTSLWWFLGGARRPSNSWLAGEVVKDIVRLPLERGSTRVRIRLNLAERWRQLYSDNRGPFNLTSGNGDGRRTIVAQLGEHDVGDIPTVDGDFLAKKRSDPAECMLFDLDVDPGQHTDLSSARPEILAGLRDDLVELLAGSDSWSQDLDEREAELSEATRKQLEAIGYVD
jgi:arylsulfatase A-like enzyme